MSQPELLKKVVQTLDALGIDYFVTGSIASSIQGEVRSTHDIDIVVVISLDKIDALVQAFPPPDYYLSRDAAVDAILRRSMFNLLAIADGEKVDFWVRRDEPYDVTCFQRKQPYLLDGSQVHLPAPEDTILVKLRWAKEIGGSEKQFTDALRVFEVQGPTLDLAYLENWAKQLGVADLWQRIKSEAQLV